jgi:uncharacterized protein
MSSSKHKRLLVSIHDVGPGFESQIDQLAGSLEGLLGGPSFSMLVVPNHWGTHALSDAPSFQTKLRNWSDVGVEMFVHGWFHRDTANHSAVTRLKAHTMTAGEGEFLGLSAVEARQRMDDGKKLVEDIIGRATAGFIAPAWLYGAGAMEALANSEFMLAEDHFKVWQPQSRKVLARGPVVTWASRTPARAASSLTVAALARRCLHAMPTVRIAVHPGDVTKPRLLSSIDATVSTFARKRSVGRYSDLIL